jgi:acyl carrier protein
MGLYGFVERTRMISESDIRNVLYSVIKSDDVWTWDAERNFLDDDALDSLDRATLALLLDERHGLKIPDQDLPSLHSIQAILNYASRRA